MGYKEDVWLGVGKPMSWNVSFWGNRNPLNKFLKSSGFYLTARNPPVVQLEPIARHMDDLGSALLNHLMSPVPCLLGVGFTDLTMLDDPRSPRDPPPQLW